jgi:hypothetical protein
MAPLVLLYELSIGLAWLFRPRGEPVTGRWGNWWDEDDDEPGGDGADQDPPPAGPAASRAGPDDDARSDQDAGEHSRADGAGDADDAPARVS